jgi:uracil-DNA glycosylase family 4
MSTAQAELQQLDAVIRQCPLCDLSTTRTKAVPGDGPADAELMFVGEGPGFHEDRQGRPFVGAAGQFLDQMLASIGLERRQVFVTNVVKCRPPNNRDPLPAEISACAPYLDKQIALIAPLVIVTLGRHSMARFFPGQKISGIHGTARVVDGRTVVALYHPAAALHQQSLRATLEEDFRKLPRFIEEARTRTRETGQPKQREDPPQQLSLF